MGRKFSGSVYTVAVMIILDHAKYFLEIRILAGIGFYAFLSSLLNQPVRNILTGMEYTSTAVVCLFLMFGTAEYPVNKSYHRFSIDRCPPSVISSVMCIHFFVIQVLWRHMAVICNVKRKIAVRSWMAADQPVILIADPYLRHCSLKNCRFSLMSIQYRIVVGIILKMKWKVRQNVKQLQKSLCFTAKKFLSALHFIL